MKIVEQVTGTHEKVLIARDPATGYIDKQMFSEAAETARKSINVSGGNANALGLLGYSLGREGKTTEARAVLDQMLKDSKEHYVSAVTIAFVFNGLGDREGTFTWLERAYQEHDPRLIFLKVDPKWRNLQSEPRFQELERRVGLPL